MKFIFKKLSVLIIILLSFTNCEFIEEIHINNKGEGNFSFKVDMSKMANLIKETGKNGFSSNNKNYDTIIYFKDILKENKDSILKLPSHTQKSLEELMDLKIQAKVDEAKDIMLFDFSIDFNTVDKLKNMQKRIELAQSFKKNKIKKNETIPTNSDISYSYNNKIFKRIVTLREQTDSVKKSLEKTPVFIEKSIYKLIYHFDKKIKKVSIKGAQISKDKKTVTITVPMDSLIKNPKILDFEIKLK